jgi:hypothetical protein
MCDARAAEGDKTVCFKRGEQGATMDGGGLEEQFGMIGAAEVVLTRDCFKRGEQGATMNGGGLECFGRIGVAEVDLACDCFKGGEQGAIINGGGLGGGAMTNGRGRVDIGVCMHVCPLILGAGPCLLVLVGVCGCVIGMECCLCVFGGRADNGSLVNC